MGVEFRLGGGVQVGWGYSGWGGGGGCSGGGSVGAKRQTRWGGGDESLTESFCNLSLGFEMQALFPFPPPHISINFMV